MKNIVFTGGHHNSALLVAKALKKKGFNIYWFGHKHTMKDDKSLSLEIREVKKEKIPFIELKTAKIHRNYNPFCFFKLAFGLMQSFYYLVKIKPVLIVAFGSYLSVPVAIVGKILGIKLIINEQTSKAGLANKFLARIADKILLTWKSSEKFFPAEKSIVTGLPLPSYIFKVKEGDKIFKNKLPIIFITGGKQGSNIINRAVEKELEVYLKDFNLIHQLGAIKKTYDYLRISRKRNELSIKYKKRYIVKKFFYRQEMIKILKNADLVISRSGAHIVYELSVLGKPAVLIPYPWAHNQEQLYNAKILKNYHGAIIIRQRDLTGQSLLTAAKKAIKNLDKMEQGLKELKEKVYKNGLQRVVEVILKQIK
jgi:UDP-N-acetylglucosamine--N-acetylmuramyl-(pentapeptide) pyrophosphoryl-undecaprenol N-acetylglucosamine transferase